jgi:O-antigen/teichoic acid export membrane protein
MGYLKDTVKGVTWMGGFRLFSRFVALGRTAILARLLLPAQFGVYGVATLVLAFLEIFTETGINIFLIQERQKIEKYVNTAWVISIIRGALISLLIILLSPLIASFFNSPEVKPLLLLISLVPFLRGFINPSVVKFQKDLEFKKEFWFRSSIFLFDSSVAVVLALMTRAPISLVWGLVAGVILEIIISFVFIKPTPKFAFETEKVKRIIGRGKWVTFAGIFDYLTRQGDDMVVAKVLNPISLGLYQMAYRLSTLPVTEIAQVAGKVTLPVYVQIANEKKRIKKAFIKTMMTISILVIPVGAALFLFPKEIVTIILGRNWLEIVPALKILAVFGVVRALGISTGSVFLAFKRQDLVALITFVKFVILAIIILPAVLMAGIVGASWAVLIASLLIQPLAWWYVIRLFK